MFTPGKQVPNSHMLFPNELSHNVYGAKMTKLLSRRLARNTSRVRCEGKWTSRTTHSNEDFAQPEMSEEVSEEYNAENSVEVENEKTNGSMKGERIWQHLTKMQKKFLILMVAGFIIIGDVVATLAAFFTGIKDSLGVAWWDESEDIYSVKAWDTESLLSKENKRQPNVTQKDSEIPSRFWADQGIYLPNSPPSSSSSEGSDDTLSDDYLDPWAQLRKFWNHPSFVKFRLSVSLANLTMNVPTLLARCWPMIHQLSRVQSLVKREKPVGLMGRIRADFFLPFQNFRVN